MDVGVDSHSVSDSKDLLAIARFGVGYNDIDVAACTAADVVFFNAVGGVERSMAEATVGWMIALSHHFQKRFVIEAQVTSVCMIAIRFE